jgi:hypothetical protein
MKTIAKSTDSEREKKQFLAMNTSDDFSSGNLWLDFGLSLNLPWI